jgi:hypothetical protein
MTEMLEFFGKIVDQDGNPVEGAIFSTLHDSTISDDDGVFFIDTDEIDGPQMINRIGYDSLSIPGIDPDKINEETLPKIFGTYHLGTFQIYKNTGATTFPEVNVYGKKPTKYGMYGGLAFLLILAALSTKKNR